MLFFSALVAGSFSLGVTVANDIDPAALTSVRFALASCVVGVVVFRTKRGASGAFQAPWRYLLLGGVFGSYFVLMFEGLKTAPPVSAAAVFTLTPIFAAIAGWLLLRQITTIRMATALIIGAAGALWVIFRADLSQLLMFDIGRGEAIYLLGCIVHAIYPSLVRMLNRGESSVIFTFGTLVAGSIVVGAWGVQALFATDWGALPPRVWGVLVYLVIFATSASFVLLQYASLRLPAAKVMAYTYLTPTWVVLWELSLGNSVPSPILLVGVGLSMIALLMLLRDEG